VTFGIDAPADVRATKIESADGRQTFMVGSQTFSLRIPGSFNVSNACAVIALARTLGVADDVIAKALADYSGTWRRFELKGEYRKALVISDYAHHPTAITSTLKAAKEFYPGRRLVVVFQPHQHNRTQKLFEKFKVAFTPADLIIITEIFDVLGRDTGPAAGVSGQDLAHAIEQQGKLCMFASDLKKAHDLLNEFIEKDDVLLIMGAGDVYTLADQLVSE
jgi:UDP-N-acetylmuramate--alanine ligase